MSKFLEPLRRIANNAVKLNPNEVVLFFIRQKRFQEFIIELNQKQIFDEGINSLGVSITPGYSKKTEELSLGITFSYKGTSKTKKEGQSPILYDSGEFFESFRVVVPSGKFARFFDIEADVEKDDGDTLTERYGKEILGLTKESIGKLIIKLNEVLVPKIQRELTKGV